MRDTLCRFSLYSSSGFLNFETSSFDTLLCNHSQFKKFKKKRNVLSSHNLLRPLSHSATPVGRHSCIASGVNLIAFWRGPGRLVWIELQSLYIRLSRLLYYITPARGTSSRSACQASSPREDFTLPMGSLRPINNQRSGNTISYVPPRTQFGPSPC